MVAMQYEAYIPEFRNLNVCEDGDVPRCLI